MPRSSHCDCPRQHGALSVCGGRRKSSRPEGEMLCSFQPKIFLGPSPKAVSECDTDTRAKKLPMQTRARAAQYLSACYSRYWRRWRGSLAIRALEKAVASSIVTT